MEKRLDNIERLLEQQQNMTEQLIHMVAKNNEMLNEINQSVKIMETLIQSSLDEHQNTYESLHRIEKKLEIQEKETVQQLLSTPEKRARLLEGMAEIARKEEH